MSKIVTIRLAKAEDADMVAAIHTASRRLAYREIYSEAYLGEPIETETRAAWSRRLATESGLVVLLAELDGRAVGFIAWVPDQDPVYGGLIDNFHMAPDAKGQGIGRKLFRAICTMASRERPDQSIFLWVYESNAAAREIYARFGGTEGDRMEKRMLDGGLVTALRVIWPVVPVEV